MAAQDTPLRRELVALIESGRFLVIGAQALIKHTRWRFTADTDYAVDGRTFQRVRRWCKRHHDEVDFEDLGEAIRCEAMGVDVLDARIHPVFMAVLAAESRLPSPEGLAAIKYVAMTSSTRPRTERRQDSVDFARLVELPKFRINKLLDYLVAPYDELRPQVAQLVADIKAGRPIQI